MDEIIAFYSKSEWEKWLKKNHQKSTGIWMVMFNKNSGVKAIKAPEALDVALCYGWITGQAKAYDEKSCLWRFCPRRPKSMWSKLNTTYAERLIKEGKMKPAGLKEIEMAKADGRWDNAYHPPSTASVPDYFLKALDKNKKAKKFFEALNKSNRYSIIFRLHTAKTEETREKRMREIIKMLASGKKFH